MKVDPKFVFFMAAKILIILKLMICILASLIFIQKSLMPLQTAAADFAIAVRQ